MLSDWPTLLDSYPDEDCGCPVEVWLYCNLELLVHFEPDGTMEMHVDAGDWDREVTLKASDMEQGRLEAFAWVDSLPPEC